MLYKTPMITSILKLIINQILYIMKKLYYLLASIAMILVIVVACEKSVIEIDEEIMGVQVDESIKGITSAKASGPSASGHGTLFYENIPVGWEDGTKRQFSFHANTMPDDTVDGNGVLIGTAGQIMLKFDIVCLTVVDNTATMAGIITFWSNNPDGVGTYCWFMVVDNGEGNNSSPDEISLFYPGLSSLDCALYNEPLYEIEGGNIQVI